MLSFLTKQIPFVTSIKKNIAAGFILGFLLAFIIIFLEPLDTHYFKSNYKTLFLSGYGIILFFVFFMHSSIENIFYNRFLKIWRICHEIISMLIFFTISGIIIYLYHYHFIINKPYAIKSFLLFMRNTILVFIPIFLPVFIYVRNKFGELIIPLPKDTISITGKNKYETLSLNRKDLLYIKALENYVEIIFVGPENVIKSRTFRQTLSKTNQQLPFLEKCHKSYLLNMENVIGIKGNSKKAKIFFKNINQSIPLSKTYYNKIKGKLNTD